MRPFVLVLSGLSLLYAAPSRAAEVHVLESPVLRLEVTAEPYGYRVIEKASGEVLVSQSGTTFTVVESAAAPHGGAGADGGAEAGSIDAAPPPPVSRNLRATSATGAVMGPMSIELQLRLQDSADSAATARATFTFTSPEVLEVALVVDHAGGSRVREELDDREERVYGVWEYPFDGNLDSRGQDHDYLGLGSNTGSLYTSGRAPFYLTSRRYGVYARSEARGRFTIAVAGKTSFSFDEPRLVYDVIYGPGYADVLGRYMALAGGAVMPPLWAFGSMWWADDFHRDLRGAANAQANVLDLATQLQTRRIPATALLIDRPFGTGSNGWGNMDWDSSFPDPPAMVDGLHDRGLELVLWIANRAWNGLYTEGRALGHLFPGGANLGPAADLRSPAAYAWMKAKLAPLVALGARGYKIDRGEQDEHPDAVQNQNVTLFARLAQETLREGPAADGFVFARNVADSGRRHAAVWNGDSAANFTGLAYSVAAGLRSGLIAMPMWGSDTGGYLRGGGGPNHEVFARWFGFSAYSPMMEVLVGDGHTPWYHYPEALVEIARKHVATHHDLIPYTRSLVYAANRTGMPVMRPMFFEQPDDPAIANLSDQYLYGPELVVAPVVTAGATARSVYLPGGRWLEYNGRRLAGPGGRSVLAPAPLDTIPVFVREGGIVPRGDILRGNNNWTPGWAPSLRIEVFPAEADTSRTFDYWNGTAVHRIAASTRSGRATVDFPDLGTPGTVEIQLRSAGPVSRNGQPLTAGRDYTFDPGERRLTVAFTGATRLEIEDAVSVFAGADELPGVSAGEPAPVTPPGESGCSCALGARPAGPDGLALLLALASAWRCGRRRGRRSR